MREKGGEEDGNGGKEKRETMGEMEKKVREDGRMRFGLVGFLGGGKWKWEMGNGTGTGTGRG